MAGSPRRGLGSALGSTWRDGRGAGWGITSSGQDPGQQQKQQDAHQDACDTDDQAL